MTDLNLEETRLVLIALMVAANKHKEVYETSSAAAADMTRPYRHRKQALKDAEWSADQRHRMLRLHNRMIEYSSIPALQIEAELQRRAAR